ncbi:hypothetical protein MHH28_03290 [Paenibacillus sp. FSL K6-1217]|uniref:hypothetical protein n=1 Tax=Paenibacillus sp. FSL K6-1217 TaxID=2921466 RepID=UPI0032442E2B
MARVRILSIGVCLLAGIAGCTSGQEVPEYTDVHSMTGLDGGLDSRDSLTSPILRDVYDRSIPEEVYDTP